MNVMDGIQHLLIVLFAIVGLTFLALPASYLYLHLTRKTRGAPEVTTDTDRPLPAATPALIRRRRAA